MGVAVIAAIDMIVILRALIRMGLTAKALLAVEFHFLLRLTVRHGTPPRPSGYFLPQLPRVALEKTDAVPVCSRRKAGRANGGKHYSTRVSTTPCGLP